MKADKISGKVTEAFKKIYNGKILTPRESSSGSNGPRTGWIGLTGCIARRNKLQKWPSLRLFERKSMLFHFIVVTSIVMLFNYVNKNIKNTKNKFLLVYFWLFYYALRYGWNTTRRALSIILAITICSDAANFWYR